MKINKKAVMEDFLQLVAWSIVIVIVFFIFTGIKTVKTKALIDKSKEIENEIDGNYLLIDFLKQKTENPDAENMAELIALYYEKGDDKIFNEIKQKVNDFFSKSFLETRDDSWIFGIYDKKENEVGRINGFSSDDFRVESERTISLVIVPLKNKGEYITIKISSVKIEAILLP